MAMMRAISVAALLCSLIPGVAAAQTVRETGKTHEDWREACEGQPDGSELCFIYQRLKLNGRTAGNVTIGYKAQIEGPIAVFNLPLGSVSLPEGLRVESDKGVDAWTPYIFCSERGCHAEMELRPRLLAALRAGAVADVVVRELRGPEARLKMSLIGLTAGLQSVAP